MDGQMIAERPADYDLPHEDWRPHQQETIKRLLDKPNGSVTLLQAPVGSGKTSLAKAMGKSEGGVTALVKTRQLQQSNYCDTYAFDILFGRANYPCPHPEQVDELATAGECLYEDNMPSCDIAHKCPFLIQKALVQGSKTRSLNYALFLSSRWTKQEEYVSEYLFMDEAHLLSDETVEWCGLTIKDSDRLKYRLPDFPSVYQSTRDGADSVLAWMQGAEKSLSGQYSHTPTSDKARRSKLARLRGKIAITANALDSYPDDWYVRSGGRALEYNGQPKPGLNVKPLTARHHFPKLFLGRYPKTVMMSATIGEPKVFAEELGLTTWEYDSIPNQFAPERRPVHVPECPVMGYKSGDKDKDKQAQIIAKYILALPDDWEGIVHSTSWAQARDLKARITKAGVRGERLYVPEQGGGTNQQMSQWTKAKSQGKGRLIITPSMSEGVDLLNERICIVAKCPFPSIAPGSFDYERMIYSNQMYRLRTAWSLEQRCGRTRRGRDIDYDTSFEVRSFVAVVDGAFRKQGIGKYCSPDFRESLIDG